MIKLLTTRGILLEIKKADPDSDASMGMMLALSRSGKVPYIMHGNRTIYDYNTLVRAINKIYGLDDLDTVPLIRTAFNAAKYFKEHNTVNDISLRNIHASLRHNLLPTIDVGNRKYVAIQSFNADYVKRLFADFPSEKQTEPYTDLDYQVKQIRKNHMKRPEVQRITS